MKGLTIILGALVVLLAILAFQHEREHKAVLEQQAAAAKWRAQEMAPAPSVWRDPPNQPEAFIDMTEEAKEARRHLK